MNIEIRDTAYGGFGVGRGNDGRAVFIPHTVEGDIVKAVITEDQKSFCYGQVKEILTLSPLRIEPACPYVGACGGCLFGHIGYGGQIQIKEKILKNAFRKYKHSFPHVEFTHSSQIGYRLRATFRAQNGKIGFFAFKSNNFIPVNNCLIIKDSLFEKAKSFINTNNLTGEIYAIETDEEVSFAHVKCADEPVKTTRMFDGITINGRISGLKHSGFNTPFGAVGVGHKTFFQANLFLLNEFQNYGASLAETALNITELYAGAGFFTSALMQKCSELSACELDKDGVKLAKTYGYPIKQAEAGEFLEKIKETDVLFLDPARDGLSNKVIKNILRLNPRKIVYVSCNPMTMARDAIKLEEKYKIESAKAFDMFPDTFHIETICLLHRV